MMGPMVKKVKKWFGVVEGEDIKEEELVDGFKCDECGKVCKSQAGLSAHIRAKHPAEEDK